MQSKQVSAAPRVHTSQKSGRLSTVFSILAVLLWILPYIYLMTSAFRPSADVISTSPTFFPRTFSLENFHGLLARMNIFSCLANSLIPAVSSTVIAVILGALFAYGIDRTGGRISIGLTVLILCLKMIPTVCIIVPIFQLICDMGLYDTRLALIITYAALNMPFVIWTMLGFYQGLPRVLDEAAHIDGASSIQTFFRVALPLSKPALATSFIFTLFLAWNDFLIALLLTSSATQTFTVGLANFLSAYSLDLGPMCAGAFLFSFPVMLLCMFAQKYILAGMTSGAVKG